MRRVSQVIVKKRLVAVFLVGMVIFFVIAGRLGYVQFFLSDFLISKAEESWSRDITFEPERGKILDSNGEVLVGNQSAPTVMVVPRQVKDADKTARNLAQILDMSEEKAYSHVTKVTSIERIHPEGRKISEEQAEAIQSLQMPGVYIAEDSERYYPHGSFLSHVLGFSGIDNQGLLGLEAYYDEELKGEKGALSFFSDAKGKRMPDMADIYKAPVDGKDLQLTIDYKVQSIMERELDIAQAKYNPDGAVALAVDPDTGKVVGMASRPNFNPANYQEVKPEVYNRNLPVWSTYEPGSTFKIITLAAALEEDLVDLEEEHFHDSGSIKVDGATLHCWKRGGHGDQTFLEVVQNSCNPGFVTLGQRLGKEKLFEYIDRFGFGEKTGIDLEGEGKGILFKPENVGPVEQATTAFGQGVSVTPIQQVMAVAAAVNGGYYYKPYIQEAWLDPISGDTIEKNEPQLKERVISEETSAEIRRSLESVVAKGTGRGAYVEGYRVGGKTGTAQKVGPDGKYMENNHIVSFIGFAPADDPELVVYLAIDNPKNTVQFGGVVAAPIVGNIMGDSLRALGVKPRKDGLEKEYSWPDEPLVEVPKVIGMEKKELSQMLMNLEVEVSGSGSKVITQAPKAGVKVPSGSTIRVYLGD
ncbi:stage V sporulation protein D (sporulation-specific penicillin-binding protein) [Halobacillus karajensis]|uniref:serine-type D-Ala-D-Ala carboxypeptidase n=1 Tax=Halobacillus karajensis TaxID=195088 RepID=A0A024P2D0_9BACI|nr:stage V sporulation protein D [Halobacillus karajensis]CDQ19845.1 Sporulation-specific penicillin-binding protein [Halobacillus karajensis]CDQ22305.1 Sporulation-specific penicillin-binding protein [Halobacillus karajensis]CDQ28146.1 Sporulation-specific penicillin-binding protein [Halobacillus karajensis]SEH71165.1 stage V sporulation protein D (sporulation-specific penicillin-binding protein) [Halobacillus karajensis]